MVNAISNVIFAVSDNSSAIVKVLEDILQWKHYCCYADKLNSIVQDVVVKMETRINSVKKIEVYYRSVTNKLLKYFLHRASIIQNVPTGWNSTFYMLGQFTELEEVIKATMTFA